jgi:polysaccharide pyruvyl transferase WcaK-like protein
MKVSIITILDNVNFGTYLQALATGLTVESLGYEAELVRYIRPVMTPKGHSKTVFKERGFLRWLKHRNDINKIEGLRNNNYDYLREFLSITKEYFSFEELCLTPPKADIYMTGSDQVWNSFYNRGVDRSFYLDFVSSEKKRVAYAASIGMDDFPECDKVETKKLLRKYSTITVRERKAKELLGTIDVESEVVLDPTLLLDLNQWSAIADKHRIDIKEEYVLIYSVELKDQDKLVEKYAIEIAKRYGLKIYQVSYSDTKKRLACADRFFGRATPNLFLNLMKNASYAVVSSFHGTAFAINFNKPFLTIAANKFNSRVQNLLEITCLENRLVSENTFNINTLEEINYDEVNELLAIKRLSSLECLRKMLNDGTD